MAPRMPVGARRTDLSADGRGRGRRRVERRLVGSAPAGAGRQTRHRLRPSSRSRRVGQRRARDPRGAGRRLPLGVARRHRARPRCGDASRRGGDRHARGERRRRRAQGRRLGGTAAAPGGRPLRGSVRSPVHAAATGRDRSRAVRSGDRSAVRLDVRHVDLARRVAAGRVVRRAPGQPSRGSRFLLARSPRGLPRVDDAARGRPSPGRVGGRRTPARASSADGALLRGASRHRGDAQELRPAVAAVGVAAGDPRRACSDWRT